MNTRISLAEMAALLLAFLGTANFTYEAATYDKAVRDVYDTHYGPVTQYLDQNMTNRSNFITNE